MVSGTSVKTQWLENLAKSGQTQEARTHRSTCHDEPQVHTEYHILEDHNRDEEANGSHGYTASPAASRAVPSHGGDGHGGHGEFDFSEVFVHQVRQK